MDPTTWAARTPDAPAVTLAGDTVTYAELAHKAAQIAYLLCVEIGLAVGDHIAVCARNHRDYLAVTWAAQSAGLVWTTVAPDLTATEAAYIVNDCGAEVLFASSAVRDLAALVQRTRRVRRRLSIGGKLPGHEPLDRAIAGLPPLVLDGREGVMNPYTAGSTGRPKGIQRPLDPSPIDPATVGGRHRDVLERDLGVGPGSVFLIPAPLYHSGPVQFAMAAQRLGAHVVLMERFDAQRVLDLIAHHEVTHLYLVPQPMMMRLLALPAEVRACCERMPHVLHTAAACPFALKEGMLGWCDGKVTEYYGASEGVGYSVIGGEEWRSHRGSVGRPRGGEVHILDEDGTELAPGETGRLWFSAPGGRPLPNRVSYRNNPAATQALYNARGWGSVGDLGSLDDGGYVYLADRAGSMIISGGINIYPREVEEALIAHSKVLDVAVRGIADPEWGQRVQAIVQVPSPMDMTDALERELIAFARERIAPYKRPRAVRFVTTPLHDESGKVRRSVLDQLASEKPRVIVARGAVVGRVLTVSDHPNAQRIWRARVEVGDSEPLEIVFNGTYKVRPGELVPVAPPGAVVLARPSGRKKRMRIRRYRGVRSEGMMCSLDELGWLEGGPDEVAILRDLQPGDSLDHIAADQRPRLVREWQRAAEWAARGASRGAIG